MLYWHQLRISKVMGPKYLGAMTFTFLTIRIPMGHFLLVLHWTQVSISSRFRDIWRYAYWGHDLDVFGSRDVIGHVTI